MILERTKLKRTRLSQDKSQSVMKDRKLENLARWAVLHMAYITFNQRVYSIYPTID